MWVGGDLKEVQKIMSGIDSVNAFLEWWNHRLKGMDLR